MKTLLPVVALVLGGCSSFSVLDKELPKLVGQPVDVAVSKLGFPNADRNIMGRKVYIWSTTRG